MFARANHWRPPHVCPHVGPTTPTTIYICMRPLSIFTFSLAKATDTRLGEKEKKPLHHHLLLIERRYREKDKIQIMGRQRDAEAELNLPPGFRFHPTDEELVVHYLCRKVSYQSLPVPIIAEVDLYKYDPWQLPGIGLV